MPFYEDFGRDFHYYYKQRRVESPMPSHLHPNCEMGIYLHDAPQKAMINGKEYSLPFPSAVLISPFSLHQNVFEFGSAKEGWERGIFFFGEELLSSYAAAFGGVDLTHSRIWRLHPRDVTRFHEILSMINQYPSDSTEQKLLFLLLVRMLFTGEAGEEIPIAGADKGSDYIGEVIRFMSEHVSEGLTADSVAARFFVSRSKLNKDFHKYTSTTFHQLLGEMKMNKAVYFLRKGNTDIRKVAIASGFENESYFYVLFKKEMGITPLQYAKRCLESIQQRGAYQDPKIINSEWGMTMDF